MMAAWCCRWAPLAIRSALSACCCSAAPFLASPRCAPRVADGHDADCLTRFAGGGAAMIVPATLAGIRSTFAEASQRNMALGLWAAVGSGGAAFGPLVGGILLEHFYWGSVFLINVPIVLVVIAINAKVPRQPARREQPLNLLQALVLIAAILMLVFSAKSALKGQLALWLTALVALGGRRC